MRARALVVFAKEPHPGEVKTRLCPPLAPEQAAELYGCMLDDVLEESGRTCADAAAALFLTVHPAAAVPLLAQRLPRTGRAIAQHGADLAARMTHAIGEAAAAGFDRIVLRGSDSPALPGDRLIAAFEALEDCDVVLSRDPDGGYALLGVRRPVLGLLDHAMSTDSVADDTLANARRLGLCTRELEPGFDIDTFDDLARLQAVRSQLLGGLCRRTLERLDTEGWWPAEGAG